MKTKNIFMIFVLVCVSALILSTPSLSDSELAIDKDWKNSNRYPDRPPKLSVVSSDINRTIMKLNIEGFSHEDIITRFGHFDRISIESCFRKTDTGYPEIPYYRTYIAIPECEDVIVRASHIKQSKVGKINVCPAPELIYDPEGNYEEFSIKSDAYSSNSQYPSEIVELVRTFKMRDQNVAEINVYPVSFNPVTNEAVFSSEIDITLHCISPVGQICVDTGPLANVCKSLMPNYSFASGIISSSSRPFLKSGFGNWEVCSSYSEIVNNETDYLIIVGDTLYNSAAIYDSLTAWEWILELAKKRAEFTGLNVSVVKISDLISTPITGSSDEDLKSEIIDIYESESAGHMPDSHLGYILLVGDVYTCNSPRCTENERYYIIPTHLSGNSLITCMDFEDHNASDFYYASINSLNDDTPDLFIGRLSVDDVKETGAIIHKILDYEPHQITGTSDPWYKNILYIIGDGFDNDAAYIVEKAMTTTPVSFNYDVVNSLSLNYTQTNQTINDKINAGVGYILELGHGCDYYMGSVGGTWDVNYYENLASTNMYPIILSVSCETGRFDGTTCNLGQPVSVGDSTVHMYSRGQHDGEIDQLDSMSERLTNIPGRGAIAFIGYSRTVEATRQPVLSFADNMFNSQASLGEITLFQYYSLSGLGTHQSAFVFLGDPGLNTFFEEYTTTPSDTIDLAISTPIKLGGGEYSPVFSTTEEGIISSILKNNGNRSASNIMLKLFVDDIAVDSLTISSLNAFDEVPFAFAYQFSQFGNHPIRLGVNLDESIAELNWDNNIVDTVVAVLDLFEDFPISLESSTHLSSPTIISDGLNGNYILVNNGSSGIDIYDESGISVTSLATISIKENLNIPNGNIVFGNSEMLVILRYSNSSTSRTLEIYDTETLSLRESVNFSGMETVVFDGHVMLYDVDNNGNLDIIYFESYNNTILGNVVFEYFGLLKIFSFDGNILTETHSLELDYDPTGITVQDIDYDNDPEFAIVGFTAGTLSNMEDFNTIVRVFNLSGTTLINKYPNDPIVIHSNELPEDEVWSSSFTPESVYSKVIFDDIDNNGNLDIIYGLSRDVGFVFLDDATPVIKNTIFDQLKRHDDLSYYNHQTKFACADLTGDGTKELIAKYENKLRVVSCSGPTEQVSVLDELCIGDNVDIVAGPLLGDLDNDDEIEIVIGYRKPQFEDLPGYFSIGIYTFSDSLVEKNGWTKTRIYSLEDGRLALSDIDGNGSIDIVLQTKDELFVLNTPWSSHGEIVWPVEDGNERLTNCNKRYISGNTNGHNVSLAGYVELLGDIVIDEGDTLYIIPGTEIAVSTEDSENAGADSTRVELTCNGHIKAYGRENEPVTFRSMAVTPDKGDWCGLFFTDISSGGELTNVKISSVDYGLKSPVTVQMTDCDISDCFIGGIYLYEDSTTNESVITSTTVSGIAPGYKAVMGIYECGGTVTIEDCAFSSGTYGVWIDDSSPVIHNTEVTDNSSVGIYLLGPASVSDGPEISNCTITDNNNFGLMFLDHPGSIDSCVITGHGQAGILCCDTLSCPEISYSRIENNTIGIQTMYNACPVIGNNSTGKGKNNSFDNSSYDILQILSDASTQIKAEYCYWGTAPNELPDDSKMLGNIDFCPFLTSDPLISYNISRRAESETRFYLYQNFPNPVSSSRGTTIMFSIPADNLKVSLRIYDVTGRKIKTLVDEIRGIGSHSVTWDGRNDNGSKVARGIYFYQLIAGDQKISKKLVILE